MLARFTVLFLPLPSLAQRPYRRTALELSSVARVRVSLERRIYHTCCVRICSASNLARYIGLETSNEPPSSLQSYDGSTTRGLRSSPGDACCETMSTVHNPTQTALVEASATRPRDETMSTRPCATTAICRTCSPPRWST